MIFPDLNKSLFVYITINELAWILEIVRKLLFDAAEG